MSRKDGKEPKGRPEIMGFGLKADLIIVPIIWNFIILFTYSGFPITSFVTLYSCLLGIAVGLAAAASFHLFGSGLSDESIHLAFVAGTLSAFYGLMSLGVLFGQGGNIYKLPSGQTFFSQSGLSPYAARNYYVPPEILQQMNATITYGFGNGGGETFLSNFPYGWVIQSIMGMMFLLGIILYCTRTSD